MFPENLDSVKEETSKRKYEELQKELSQKSRQHSLRNTVINTLIAAVLVLGLFFLFLWLLNKHRYS